MFKIKKKSGWTWQTAGGGAVGLGFVTAGAGTFVLNSPDGGTTTFKYKSAGAGLSVGMKFNAQHATYESFSTGQLYLLSAFPRAELDAKDIEGFCVIEEVAAGAGLGGAVTAMLLGVPATSLPAEIVKHSGLSVMVQAAKDYPNAIKSFFGPAGGLLVAFNDQLDRILGSDAKALLICGGTNAGPQLVAGISGSVGYVSIGETKPPPPPPPPKPPGPEPILVREISMNEWIVRVPGDVLFDFDKFNLKHQARETLEEVVRLIKARSPRRISIDGHTDSIGDAKYNLALSDRRARSVAQWLIARRVVNTSSLTTRGLGERNPVKPNRKADGSDDRDARALNRRVEIYLIK